MVERLARAANMPCGTGSSPSSKGPAASRPLNSAATIMRRTLQARVSTPAARSVLWEVSVVWMTRQRYDAASGKIPRLGAEVLRGRYGVWWMIVAWLALALMLAACVWAGMWIADIIT